MQVVAMFHSTLSAVFLVLASKRNIQKLWVVVETCLDLLRHQQFAEAIITNARPGSIPECVVVRVGNSNLRAVLALLLYIRKRHPAFR